MRFILQNFFQLLSASNEHALMISGKLLKFVFKVFEII